MFKKIIILIGVFSLLGIVYGETIGSLEVRNYSSTGNIVTSDNSTFSLNNLNGSKYILKFTHYGTINWTITKSITLYLNNNPIYTINEKNACNIHNKPYPNVALDVTNRIQNGSNNTLKLESNGAIKNDTYYKLKDIILIVNTTNTSTNSTSSNNTNTSTNSTSSNNTPTAKAPIQTPAIIISILAMTFIILKRENNS